MGLFIVMEEREKENQKERGFVVRGNFFDATVIYNASLAWCGTYTYIKLISCEMAL